MLPNHTHGSDRNPVRSRSIEICRAPHSSGCPILARTLPRGEDFQADLALPAPVNSLAACTTTSPISDVLNAV